MTVSNESNSGQDKSFLRPGETMKDIQLSVLKELVADVNTPVKTLADDLELPYQTVNGIVMDFVRAMVGTRRETDWPERVRGLYNKGVTDSDLTLTKPDMEILKGIMPKYHTKKVEKIAKKVRAEGQSQQPPLEEEAIYTDSYAQPPPQQQPQQYAQQQQQQQQPPQRPQMPSPQEYLRGFGIESPPYMDAVTLMKFCLDTTFLGPRAGQVSPFLIKFQLWKDSWLRNPGGLLAALKSDFGPQAGETVYMMFFDKLAEVEPSPDSMYNLTGMSSYRPTNQIPLPRPPQGGVGGMGMGMGGGGMGGPMDFDPSNPASVMAMGDSDLDKYAARILKMSYAMMMAKFQQQQLGNSMGMGDGGNGQGEAGVPYKIVEDIGQDGRVIRRHRVPDYSGMYGYGQPIQSSGSEAVVRMYEKLVDMQAEQNRVLLQKQESPNKFVEDIARDAIARRGDSADPLTQFNKVLELTQQVRGMMPQNQQKSIDELRLEKDSDLAKMELQYNMKKQEDDRRMREEESKKADERLSDTIKGVGDVVNTTLGPLIQGAMASYGQGLLGKAMGVPGQVSSVPGVPPGQVPQQPVPVVQQRVVQQGGPPKPGAFTPEQIKQMENEYRINEEWRQLQEEKNRLAQSAQQIQQIQDVQRHLDNMPIDQLQNMALNYRQNKQGLETEAAMVEATLARRMQFGGQPQMQMPMPMPMSTQVQEEEYLESTEEESTDVLTEDYGDSGIQTPNTGTGYSDDASKPTALPMNNNMAEQEAHMQVEVGLPPNSNQNLRPMEFGVSVNTEPVEVPKKKKTTVRKQKKVTSETPIENKTEKVGANKELETEGPETIIDETEIEQITEE